MQLILAGINHQSAPLAVREKVAVNYGKLREALSHLRSSIPRGIIVSTCNRTEVYIADNDGPAAESAGLAFLRSRSGLSNTDLLPYVYVLKGEDAVTHLFRVACGLESMIIGESEVLGQVKQALEAAESLKMVNIPLRQLFRSAVRTGRRVRAETGIARNALSVSSVAVDFAADIVGDLTKCKMLVIGTGEAGRLVAKVAGDRGTSRIGIASRTNERASGLAAALNGIPVSLNELAEELAAADMVVTCAGAPHRILDIGQVQTAMKSRPGVPLVIIDIAMPRNVQPEVAQIPNVFLYNIDHLTEVSDLNRKQREGEIRRVEEIISEETEKFISWWQQLEVRPTIGALMSRAERIRRAQLMKTLKKLPGLSAAQYESLEAMTRSIVTKIMKDPIQHLKSNGDTDNIDLVRELFQLDKEEPQ